MLCKPSWAYTRAQCWPLTGEWCFTCCGLHSLLLLVISLVSSILWQNGWCRFHETHWDNEHLPWHKGTKVSKYTPFLYYLNLFYFDMHIALISPSWLLCIYSHNIAIYCWILIFLLISCQPSELYHQLLQLVPEHASSFLHVHMECTCPPNGTA